MNFMKLYAILILFLFATATYGKFIENTSFASSSILSSDFFQTEEEVDTTEVITDEENTQADDESDSAETTEETDWSYSGNISLMSKSVQKGFIIGDNKALMSFGSSLSYSEFSLFANVSKQATANIWADYSIGLDYSHSFADWFSLSAGYSYFKYLNDGVNPNSENSNSLDLTTSFSYSDFSFDLGYEMLLGNIPVSYISATLNYNKKFGDFTVDITADVTTSSYSKNSKNKLTSLKKITSVKSLLYTGILYLVYDLPKGFYVGLTGTVTDDYKGNIEPIVEASVGYSIDF